jgi:N-acetylmuramoyl-L-alanine amidase
MRKSFSLAAIALQCFATMLLGAETYDLAQRLEESGAIVYWEPLGAQGLIVRSGHVMSFRLGHDAFLFDYKEILRLKAISYNGKQLLAEKATLDAILGKFEEAEKADAPLFKVAAIVIDPGHGGKDSGAVSELAIGGKKVQLLEKDINLSVSKELVAMLRAEFGDRHIIMTRNDDRALTLNERTEKANSVSLQEGEAILYVSIHSNSSFNKSAEGFEVYYLPPDVSRTLLDDEESKRHGDLSAIINAMREQEFVQESVILAQRIIDGVMAQNRGITSRGIKEAAYFVVRHARMPAVLVELGFITSSTEGPRLTDPEHLKALAQGIYSGIRSFILDFESSRGILR